jgi:phosphopantothenoylcysteine decarboxylase/phosphopantothenate--cysteine ligase
MIARCMELSGRTVALVVTGSIAAYKAVEVARLLVKAGATVLPVLTRSAERFVGATTFAGITGHAAHTDMWDPSFSGEMHIALAARADVVAIVPATADLLARLAHGRADDLATALALSARAPIVAAPAMHPRMWEHPATQRNVALLAEQRRVELVGPVFGEVASGERGVGRMADPAAIVAALVRALAPASPRDLEGARVVVTAGPSVEDLDPVRFLGNRSTGKMGFAVAARAAARGASVTLIAGPVSLATPAGVARIDVRTTLEMKSALEGALGPTLDAADALVMAAAVADYRPKARAETKTKKGGETSTLELVRNPDLLAGIGAVRTGSKPVLVGFAVETGSEREVVAYARAKLAAKKVDLVVANAASDAFGRDDNVAVFVSEGADAPLGRMEKLRLADRILDFVRERLAT